MKRTSALTRLFQRRESIIPQLVSYTMLTLLAVLVLWPLLFALLGAFRPRWDISRIPPTLWPRDWTLGNFEKLNEFFPVLRLYFNSLFVTTMIVAGQVLTSTAAGYVFAKFEFPGRQAIFLAILATMMIPGFVTIVPLYVLVARDLNWADTYQGLIVPSLCSSFGIFLLRQFAHTIPEELLDAARVDGAGELRILLLIGFPLMMPAIGALAIFAFIWNWGSFFWPLFIVSKNEMLTLPLALNGLITTANIGGAIGGAHGASHDGLLLAGDAVALMPVLIVFFLFQRYITEGVTFTGLAGR
jgi:multiple sugar transport system permease protein